jgi:hypothetical protein
LKLFICEPNHKTNLFKVSEEQISASRRQVDDLTLIEFSAVALSKKYFLLLMDEIQRAVSRSY